MATSEIGTARVGSVIAVAALTLVACGGGAERRNPIETQPLYKMRMAESLMNAGRVTEALTTMEQAIAADPESAPLRLQFGQLSFRAGRYVEAEAAFLKALEIDPYATDAHNFLGSVYQELGRPADAENEYRAALADRAYPTPELVYLNLGLLYGDLERDEEAVSALRTAVGIDPKFYKAHFLLAAELERTGQIEEAAREYEVAEPGYRSSGDYYYRRGFAYFRLGRVPEARQALERVQAIAPGSESAARADELLRMMEK